MTQARSLLTSVMLSLGTMGLTSDAGAAVTYQLKGTVLFVSDGTGGLLNLTGAFQIGDPFILACTVDPSTLDTSDPHASACTGCVTAMSVDVDGYTGTLQESALSALNVYNDYDEGGAACTGTSADEFIVVAGGINAAPVGNATLFSAGFEVTDCEGTAWSSSDVPRSLSISELESGTMALTFMDGTVSGTVIATMAEATVPARATTWGQVKTRYR